MNNITLKSHPDSARTAGRNAGDMVDDRIEDGVFRVDRSVYTDRDIFAQELARIFTRTWVFLCHESQVPEPGDYFSTYIGEQPVFVIRGKDGEVRSFLNACAHRGAVLTPRRQGRALTLTCRFHGWCFNAEGRCTKIKNEKEGWPEASIRSEMSLKPVARVASYRGFVFGCLDPDVADLETSLAGAKEFIDLLADQSPEGLEVVSGSSDYIIRGNWKMQAENGVDGYHVGTVHRVFASAMANREQRDGVEGVRKTEAGRIAGGVPTGCYDLGQGHMMIWAGRSTPEAAPLWEARDRLLATYPEGKVRWMIERGRNLCLFPNVLLMDQPSTQIRVFRPLDVDRTLVSVYCIAPKGESPEARAARLRKFEDFYMVTGMATPDDLAALEDCESGAKATGARWNDMTRGLATMTEGPDEVAAELGAKPVTSNSCWDFETLYHGFYRRWSELMTETQEG
ncbi:Rieske 2Fe-2S domain-containing protein [Telmatospirillum sp. J64-1]|uniref:aromatic ring-hydroxylating oxygenase subunit alpha n=1 Tax=Telmatospirillum sp. J64-1 TaxID=2502183 RepID=UPI00115E80CD|nr:aromatic ring-hydroxylating dioxygenase subunit alpha [Telmatospirillum sp. J64-1]